MPESVPPPAPPVTLSSTRLGSVGRLRIGFVGFSRVVFSRPLGIVALVGVILGAFVLPPTGIAFSTCGFHTSTGYPCVGCGLTRSVTSFLQGDFALALAYHPFGPVFAIIFVLLGISAILPERWREAALSRLDPWDRALGIATVAFFALLIVYGIFRISLVASGDPDLEWWKSADAPPVLTEARAGKP